jgi:hypothetical protein
MTRIAIDMEIEEAQELLRALDVARARAMAEAEGIKDQDEDARDALCIDAGALGLAYDRVRAALKNNAP